MGARTCPNVEQLVHPQHRRSLPILANNIVTYGGRDITITDNVVADTITNGGGIHVANRYPGVNSGRHRGRRHHHGRPQHPDPHRQLRLQLAVRRRRDLVLRRSTSRSTGATINVTDTDILDSSYAAIHWIEGATQRASTSTTCSIDGAGTYALQIQAPGAADVHQRRATGIAQANPIHNCVGSGFQITQGAGNSGWYSRPPYCGPWPAPGVDNGGVPRRPAAAGATTAPAATDDPPATPPPTRRRRPATWRRAGR